MDARGIPASTSVRSAVDPGFLAHFLEAVSGRGIRGNDELENQRRRGLLAEPRSI